MRVGALPKFPSNALNYNLTWSTDGVINEYCEPCEAIVNGQLRETQPLEELEEFSLDGILYEAFNTSGGLGTLCETLAGKVRNLNYRTIRYPGHAAIMKALLNDLRLRDRRELLKDILENAVPITLQDVVIVFVTVSGMRGGQLVQETYANKIYAAPDRRPRAQRDSDHDRGRHLRGARYAERRSSAAVRSHQAGRDRSAAVSRQSLRPLLRNVRARGPTCRLIARRVDEGRNVGEGRRARARRNAERGHRVGVARASRYSFSVTAAPHAPRAVARLTRVLRPYPAVIRTVNQQHGRRVRPHEIDGL